jgi:AcrR family transcriptional regulator
MTVTRLSRAERKEQTRQALLDAGRDLFVREGFHGATLDRVAAEAGFTKGAVYASFPTKADLFLAIFERRTDERIAAVRRMAQRARSFDEMVELLHRDWQRVMRTEHDWSVLLIEFWVHAARDEPLRRRLAQQRGRMREVLVEAARAQGAEQELGLDVEDFIAGILALGNGLNLEALLEPDGAVRRFSLAGTAFVAGARR